MTHKVIIDVESLQSVGRSYYCFCLETALTAIIQARALVEGDAVDLNHALPTIQQMIAEALEAS